MRPVCYVSNHFFRSFLVSSINYSPLICNCNKDVRNTWAQLCLLHQSIHSINIYSVSCFSYVSGPPMGMTVAMAGAGPGSVHSKLVGQLGPYSSHGHSSTNMSNMYTPLVNIGGGKSVASGQHSVASLQMVWKNTRTSRVHVSKSAFSSD